MRQGDAARVDLRRQHGDRAGIGSGDAAEDVLSDAEAAIFQLSDKRIGRGFMGVQEIVRESFGSVDALLQRGQRITGLATHYTDLDEMTSGLQRSDLVIDCGATFHGQDCVRDEYRGECGN